MPDDERCAARDLLNTEEQGDTDTPGDRHLSSASISGDEGGGSGAAAGLLLLLVGVNAECSLVCSARPATGAVSVDMAKVSGR